MGKYLKIKGAGGLDVKDLVQFKRSSLNKWKWNILKNENFVWSKILISKYGGWNIDGGNYNTRQALGGERI